jgi:hypothetical protein
MDQTPDWIRWAYSQAVRLNGGPRIRVSGPASELPMATPAVLKGIGLKRVPARRPGGR